MDTYITKNAGQTRKLGEILAQELAGGPARNASRSDADGEIICLSGDLGSGKTTFAQGVLRGLKAKGQYTSPTFVVMKHYKLKRKAKSEKRKIAAQIPKLENAYHIDAYRVGAKDILELGWEEIVAKENNILIVEWAERIGRIIPKGAVWIEFTHVADDTREIVLKKKGKAKKEK